MTKKIFILAIFFLICGCSKRNLKFNCQHKVISLNVQCNARGYDCKYIYQLDNGSKIITNFRQVVQDDQGRYCSEINTN